MPWSDHFLALKWAAGLALLAGPVVGQSAGEATATPGAGKPAPATPVKADAEATGQAVEVAASDLSSLNRLLPVGKTARKVTVPTVDETGQLTSVVTMGAITRIDEDNFELEKVVLTSFDIVDGAAPGTVPDQTVITLITARYHAPTRVLVSDRPVTIRKPALFMTGDSLRYESAAGRALIKGKSMALITDGPRLNTPAEAEESGPPDEIDDMEDGPEHAKTQPKEAAAPTPASPIRQ